MSSGARIQWDERRLEAALHDPDGPVGRAIAKAAQAGLASAKRRALRRTGKMADEMYVSVGSSYLGPFADIVSPARSPEGFPYPLVHERRGRVRDRRPHRSLIPALRDVRRYLEAQGRR